MTRKVWFRAKEYGWGWYPSSWQGWLTLAIFVGINVYIFVEIDSRSHSGSDSLISYVIPFVVSLALLLLVCFLKGEKPRWRWGK